MLLREAIDSHKDAEGLVASKMKHVIMVMLGRAENKKKQEKDVLSPTKYCSIMVDEVDQSAIGLQLFVTKSEDEAGHALRIRLTSLLQHRKPPHLFLSTMAEELATVANLKIETIDRFIADLPASQLLSESLYIHLDNCTRENKKKFVFAYLQSLAV